MKTCVRCQQEKSFEAFPIAKRMRDGRGSWCKECRLAYMRTDRGRAMRKKYGNSEKGRRYMLDYSRTEKCKKRQWEYRHSPQGIEMRRRRDTRKRPHAKARYAVGDAVKAGKLPRVSTLPCLRCSNQAHEYHHWKGYEPENYLNVVPLCRPCHRFVDSVG